MGVSFSFRCVGPFVSFRTDTAFERIRAFGFSVSPVFVESASFGIAIFLNDPPRDDTDDFATDGLTRALVEKGSEFRGLNRKFLRKEAVGIKSVFFKNFEEFLEKNVFSVHFPKRYAHDDRPLVIKLAKSLKKPFVEGMEKLFLLGNGSGRHRFRGLDFTQIPFGNDGGAPNEFGLGRDLFRIEGIRPVLDFLNFADRLERFRGRFGHLGSNVGAEKVPVS